jgi:hypothetical protein
MSNNLCHFFIFSEIGNCLYKHSTEENLDLSLQGILQALFFTANDYNSEIKTISTDSGLLGYKSFQFKEKTILFAIVLPNYFGEEELSYLIIERVLEYLYNILVMHIGLIDLYNNNSPNEIEKLKRMFDTYEPSIFYILKNFSKLNFLLRCEKKFEIEKDVMYPIKHYLENFKNFLKVDFLCLLINGCILWASADWYLFFILIFLDRLSLDIVDRLLFISIAELYGDNDITEIPIYFAKTILEDESTGKTPYKLFCLNLLQNVKLILLSDVSLNLKKISDS